jgi:hypothetical protein
MGFNSKSRTVNNVLERPLAVGHAEEDPWIVLDLFYYLLMVVIMRLGKSNT